jgi:hypothetical protein
VRGKDEIVNSMMLHLESFPGEGSPDVSNASESESNVSQSSAEETRLNSGFPRIVSTRLLNIGL